MLLLGIFLIFCKGEIIALLKLIGVKKRGRNWFGTVFNVIVGVLICGSLVKRAVKKYVKI